MQNLRNIPSFLPPIFLFVGFVLLEIIGGLIPWILIIIGFGLLVAALFDEFHGEHPE
jgi:hypothetical protein